MGDVAQNTPGDTRPRISIALTSLFAISQQGGVGAHSLTWEAMGSWSVAATDHSCVQKSDC